jgi:hypothetical protein
MGIRTRLTEALGITVANVEVVDEGVILKPSRPPVAPRLLAVR